MNEFGNGVGFGTASKNERKEIENEMMLKKELEKTFSPEFINRLDDIIYFKTLDKGNILEILDVELSKVMPRLESLGFKIKIVLNVLFMTSIIGLAISYLTILLPQIPDLNFLESVGIYALLIPIHTFLTSIASDRNK